MSWEFFMVTPEQMEREIERHFARGARYVLVRSGPAFSERQTTCTSELNSASA
jgi:hypothetical protein